MGFVWTPIAFAGIVAHLVTWFLAILVYKARPGSLQNRALAVALLLDGAAIGAGTGWMYVTDDPQAVLALQAFVPLWMLSILFVYLLFLSTLRTRLVAPLATPVGRAMLVVLAVLSPMLYLLNRSKFMVGYRQSSFAPYTSDPGPWFGLLPLFAIVLGLCGLTVTFLHARNVRGTPLERQGRWLLAAFIVRDGGFLLTGIMYGLVPAVPSWFSGVFFPAIMLGLYGFVLAYSILRTQLFGIDLTVKRGIRRSALLAPFAVFFFVATESLEGLLPFDSYWAGLASAGALTLAVAPLQRMSHRVADRLMPGVEDTAEYRNRRAQEIYDAAWAAARGDGEVTDKERALLDRLAAELGIGHPA